MLNPTAASNGASGLRDGARMLEFPVRFAETDAMGIVHHASYIVWLEAGRIAWLEAAGTPYAQIAAGGRHFAVTGLHMSYRRSVRFGAIIQVITRLTQLRSRQIAFSYTVHEQGVDGQPGDLLATGVSEHMCVDLSGRVTTLPPDILNVLQETAQGNVA